MNKKQSIAQRIAQYLEAKNISQRSFAQAINAQPSKICRQLNGESALTSDLIDGFVSTYTDINLTWLLLGQPPMLLPQPLDKPQQPAPQPYFVRGESVADTTGTNPATTPTAAPGPSDLAQALQLIRSQQDIIDRQALMLENLLKQLNDK